MSHIQYTFETIEQMMNAIGVTPEDQIELCRLYEPARIQRHAAQTIFCMTNPNSLIRSPVAWFKASLRANWGPPPGFDAQQEFIHVRVDEYTWLKIQREIREEESEQ